MTDPTKILERHAERMYEAYRIKRPRDAFGNKTPEWEQLSNNGREIWRETALAALRSEESVLDEMRREGRPLSVQAREDFHKEK